MKLDIIKENINFFKKNMPYKELPFSKKTWGHKFHSLCSYQGKLKPSIAYWLVKLFSNEGDTVLDPLGGVGTIPFEACLQGRIGITNDISPLAAVVGASKIKPPTQLEIKNELNIIKDTLDNTVLDDTDYLSSEFGLNSAIKNYFHQHTLDEILKIRKYFMKNTTWTSAENYIKANILHILHGNRPYALSRKSHSLTPFSPTGDFEYKSLYERLNNRLNSLEKIDLPKEFNPGKFYFGSYEDLPLKIKSEVDVIITSPPFVGMRFDRPNWMRLWLCGWNENDFLTTSLNSLDRKQSTSWDIYDNFFRTCSKLLKKEGLIILHLGGSNKYDMTTELLHKSSLYFDLIDIVDEDVSQTETHGIKDKGTTDKHKYIFMINKKS